MCRTEFNLEFFNWVQYLILYGFIFHERKQLLTNLGSSEPNRIFVQRFFYLVQSHSGYL